MGFPNLPEDFNLDIDLDPEQVALLLLVSIAFEELALAHVINVEAEKLQAAVGSPLTPGGTANPDLIAGDLDELLDANRAAERMLRSVIKKEMLLQFKTEDVFDFLAGVTTTAAAGNDCNCSVTPSFTSNLSGVGIAPIIIPTLPLVITANAGTSLTISADICDSCTAGDNNFFYNYNRPASGPPNPLTAFSQTFTAVTFGPTECLLDANGLAIALRVSGTGNAVGTGAGSVTGTNILYTATFDEVANTVTLILFNALGTPVFEQIQPVNVNFEVDTCPPV